MNNDPQKAYIVTSGEYSDYHIARVFLSREKAELYCSLLSDANVEEYDISDDAVQGPCYFFGRRTDSISVLSDGSMLYYYGKFDSNNYNSVDIPGCDVEYDTAPCYKISWPLSERRKCEQMFRNHSPITTWKSGTETCGSLPWAKYSPWPLLSVPEEAVPAYIIQRTNTQCRSDMEPPKDVLRKQMIDLANKVKHELACGASHEQIESLLAQM